MSRNVMFLLCFWCIGFATCESARDDHVELLQRSVARHAENDDLDDDDDDEDDLDDLDDDDDDDFSASEDEKNSGVSVCASEDQQCQCTGTVYYGKKFVNGRPGGGATTSLDQLKSSGYKSQSVTGSITCSNRVFGDPLWGYYKYCMCEAGNLLPSSAYVCAQGENAQCQCDGTVYYGAKFVGGRPGGGQTTSLGQLKSRGYKSKSVSGSITCNTGNFGGDPLWGFYKYCYCEPRETPSPTPSPTPNPTPSPTPSPTFKCNQNCVKKYKKFAKKGKAEKGKKKMCSKNFCKGCDFCN